MGAFTSRQNNAAVEEAEQASSHAYKYPPRSGNFFGSHFIMGGERFDTPQPESYLFGENADLNFLGSRPTSFPYPPPQTNEPTKTLKSLVNIRKESVRFVRVPQEKIPLMEREQIDGNIISNDGGARDADEASTPQPCLYNVDFIFDTDVRCAITIYWFCTEEVSPSGVTLTPRDGFASETYYFDKGINQYFSQPNHIFNPLLTSEDDFAYNPQKDQYPVAIHCVVDEGNDECRQSHTTICVIDHHPESNSYVLRALKQKIFVDGLCYLLQEIYGIENKAVNKSSIDEEIDDHGSECVICMSETRDTLILPCRHLCLCNSCADSLRYQANNCPICRAPFRALLQIRAVQKGIATTHALHQNTPTSLAGEQAPCHDQHIPPGYMPVSLIEALNGPPQYVIRARPSDDDITDVSNTHFVGVGGENNKTTSSPSKTNSQRRSKIKKNASTSTSTPGDVGIQIQTKSSSCTSTLNTNGGTGQLPNNAVQQNKLQFVNEHHSLKLPKTKRISNNAIATNNDADDDDDDSENEKLSPLLSPTAGKQLAPQQLARAKSLKKENTIKNEINDNHLQRPDVNDVDGGGEAIEIKSIPSLKKNKRTDLSVTSVQNASENDDDGGEGGGGNGGDNAATLNAEDSDYYTPEDTNNSILSPLCKERPPNDLGGVVVVNDGKLGNFKVNANTAGSFKGGAHNVNKNLHKKSTSVGNIVGPNHSGVPGVGNLKGNVSSLPDMLDSPISGSGNSASTRSSSDSYSSSSSTKQLLNPTTNTTNALSTTATAANIILDDKTAIQNAVNV